MKSKVKSFALTFAKLTLAVGLIAYMFKKGLLDVSSFKSLLTPGYIALGLSLTGLNLLLVSFRWRLILKARGFNVKFLKIFGLYLIGNFFNYALPGSIGGDVVKAYYISQDHRERRMDAILSVVIDRILGLYALVVIAMLAIAFNLPFVRLHADLSGIALSTLLVFTLMSCFLITAFSRRVGEMISITHHLKKMPLGASLERAYIAAQGYGSSKAVMVQATGVSLLSHLASIAFMVTVGHALGETDVSLATYFFAVPIGFIISSLPLAPAGLGVGQVAFLVLFQMYSTEKSMLGQTAITAFQMALLVWGLPGALLYLRRKKPNLAEVL